MQYKFHNLILNIGTDAYDNFMGNMLGYIDSNHWEEFSKEHCSIDDAEWDEDALESDLGLIERREGEYFTCDPDVYISYMSFLLNKEGNHTINVNYSEPYWAIHDCFHAYNDESGCTIYVSHDIEAERIVEALEVMVELDIHIGYNFLEEIEQAFRVRFNKDIHLIDRFYYELLDNYEEE